MTVKPNEFQISVGKIIKEHRQKKGITQEKLGDLTNIDGANIGKYERGERVPILKNYIKIFQALEIDQEDYMEQLEKLAHQEEP